MYCVKCGKEIAINSPVCVHCGATQEKQKTSQTIQVGINESAKPKTAESKLGNVGKVLRVLTKVFLVLGAILLLISFPMMSARGISATILTGNIFAIIGGTLLVSSFSIYIIGLLFSGFSELLMNTRKSYELLEKNK